jgi:peptidoglycan/LPS O-acetylase OafA/YrhL
VDIGRPERGISYLWKRIIRIYPIYWVVIVLILAKVFLLGNSETFIPESHYSWVASFLLLPQHSTANPGANIGDLGAPIDFVAWTLEYEVIFYAFFLILILNQRVGIFLGIIALVAHLFDPATLIFPLSMLKQPYLLIFALGMGAAWISRREFSRSTLLAAGSLGLMLVSLVSGVEIYRHVTDHVELTQLILGAGFFLLIVALVGLEKQGIVIGGHPVIQLIGAASYSIYLIHAPLLHLAVKTFSKFSYHASLLPLLFMVLSVITVLIRIGVHQYIEQPLLGISKRLLGLKSATSS